MDDRAKDQIQAELDRIFRDDFKTAFASLTRMLGDSHLAEESLQEAFAIATEKWPREGVPKNPRSWLISTARFKAIDGIRKERRTAAWWISNESRAHEDSRIDEIVEERISDDLLRLIFICCHPVLPTSAQVALTLREVCGLTTTEIARAFLMSESAMAQRISRAKAKLRKCQANAAAPPVSELDSRLSSVLKVIYLVFNEGYYASDGDSLTTEHLSSEALRLGELLAHLIPHAEVMGLNALMSFSESRREARQRGGEIILLEDQERDAWNKELISAGNGYLSRSKSLGQPGYYTLQALISAEHTNAESAEATNWIRIVELFDRLDVAWPSPVIKLNRAVAVAMSGQIAQGLEKVNEQIEVGGLRKYGLAHAAKGDLLRRQGKWNEAKSAYGAALELARMDPERRFLSRRIKELEAIGT